MVMSAGRAGMGGLSPRPDAHGLTELEKHVAAATGRYRLQHAKGISLANLGLVEVPEALYGLDDVELVDVTGNLLTEIPARLAAMPHLRRIVAPGNPLERLPDGVGIAIDAATYARCRDKPAGGGLEVVVDAAAAADHCALLIEDLAAGTGPRTLLLGSDAMRMGPPRCPAADSGLSRVFDSLGRFAALDSLTIRGLRVDQPPAGLRAMRRLTRLYLNDLGLFVLPDWLGELPLKHLSVAMNDLENLPAGLAGLRDLATLDLSGNPLRRIPPVVFQLDGLISLMLHGCPLREIPADILRLDRLRDLAVTGERIVSPPPEVATKGVAAIRDYWRQRGDAGVDYLCEAKLIIVGEAGAGKTSLAHKIVEPGCQLSPAEPSTEGIDVLRHAFPTTIRPREQGTGEALQRMFQVNIWDFGGQEIYHATHQFFLTRRSVYVLVCDDRKEDTDFAYWLRIVDLLSDGSPLIIVQNEKQERTRDIDLAALRSRYSNLRGALRTNLATGRGLDRVVREIHHALEALPHVGTGLPATWKRVREALEQDSRDYIGVEDYLRICRQHGFAALKDSLQLSGYLHDLGICLHFQDDPVLKHYVILKPSWGTDAVYRVLDDPAVIRQRGHFTLDQARQIWSGPRYENMQHELLQLMTRFQLCYALDDGRAYIAPQRLSPEKPAYPWPPTAGVVVRYEYAFLPKGIITRFIVGQHRLIADGIVWKTGVVLERDGTRAEVIEAYDRRRIVVRTAGRHPQGLLAIVDDQLERLHGAFHGLQVERILPCPCAMCAASPEPFGFALSSLLNAVMLGERIQCHRSCKLVDAAALVLDVLPGALPAADGPCEAGAPAVEAACPVPEVFVSYAWRAESQAIVDRLEQALADAGIRLVRDCNTLRYRDSIRDFMKRIGRGDSIVVIISDAYLKSENCMFELLEIEQAARLRERIFPILLPDAAIHKPVARARYIRHWEMQMKELDDELKQLQGQHLPELHDALNLYADIRRMFDRIVGTLHDMNALTPQWHEQTDYDALVGQLKARLGIGGAGAGE